MSDTGPTTGNVPSGATMRPQYMGRTMNCYPVSEPEMEHISSLNALAAAGFSAGTFLLAMGASIWINASFYTELTAEAKVAAKYVAPLLVVFSIICAFGGIWAQRKRKSAWGQIKAESQPVQTVAVAANPELVVANTAEPGIAAAVANQ
jgi:hypothetical protein